MFFFSKLTWLAGLLSCSIMHILKKRFLGELCDHTRSLVCRVGPDAWSLMYPSIPEKLQSLYNDGYKLVCFSFFLVPMQSFYGLDL